MKQTAFCVTLTLCAIFLVGCAAQVQSKTQAPNSAQAELPQVRGTDNAAEMTDTPLLPAEGKATETDAGVESSKSTTQADASANKAAEKQPSSDKTAQSAVPKPPATAKQEPTPTPPPAPTPEPAPTPTPEPDPAPPVTSGDIYSVTEAVRTGNEYAKAQYGVTIDTTMTAADSSYFPGTADSVAWLAVNGGQEALNRAVQGNVDATFQHLAAMDGADAVRAYARFNCTVRYSAASDEYIVVVLYG